MTMRFNGTELEEVRFNGVDCEKVYFNGELVFEKVAGNMLTIGSWWGGYGNERPDSFGFDLDKGIGDLQPREIDGVTVDMFVYFEDRSGPPGYTGYIFAVDGQEFPSGAGYMITVGGYAFPRPWYSYGWHIRSGYIEAHEYALFPKEGVVPVKVERIL